MRFRRTADAEDRDVARRRASTELEQRLPLDGLELVRVQPGRSTAAARAVLEHEHAVIYAEPNVYRRIEVIPSDPYFGRLWGLHNTGQSVAGTTGTADADIDAPEAWDVTTGTAAVTVAVVDTGVDLGHPDLAPNIWSNPVEAAPGNASNGVDDDRNGLVDDAHGWDWVGDDADPSDANGHGTHVAGTIGARGNDGIGVAGVDWRARLMPLRVLDASGSGTLADVIRAYSYAAGEGAAIVNASLGGTSYSRAEFDTIRAHPDLLFVVAAGNNGSDDDVTPEYPCAYDAPNVLCVAASNQNDGLASFSNYGSVSVDLAAPGTNILSTQPNGGYAYLNGTSMATPHASGVAALLKGFDPAASSDSVKAAILAGADARTAFAGRTVSGGRLNARAALAGLGAPAPPPGSAQPAPAPAPPASGASPAPPVVSVALSLQSMHLVRSALRKGLRLRLRCSVPCRIRSRAVISRVRPRRARRPRAITAAVRNTSLFPAGRIALVMRLRPAARRVLRQARSARVIVTASVVAGSRSRHLRRALTLHR